METVANKRTLTGDPQYFGVYLNMARHNVFVISNHLSEKFKLNLLHDDEEIGNSFLTRKIKEKNNYVFTQLIRFMPIAKVFDPERWPKTERENIAFKQVIEKGKDFESLGENLKICFSELNGFRNDYSHYFSLQNAANRKLKVDSGLSVFLRQNFSRAIEYSKKRFTDVFVENDFELAEKMELVTPNDEITQEGLVFFTCLFLDRENAFQFFNRVVGLKGTQYNPFKATREVFSAFCVNLPHDKFISDDPIQALTLDMLNELIRCPEELFNNLSPEAKRQFQPQLDKIELQNIEENSIPEEVTAENYAEYINGISTKKRHNDRFAYFALRYLDHMESFKIYFQINLGKLLLKTYPKAFLNGTEQRDIIENAKVFSKLKFYLDEEEVSAKLKLSAENYFTQFSPHFHNENNKIGISLNTKQCKVDNGNSKLQPPDAFLSIHELPKVILLELFAKGKAEELIRQFLKTSKEKLLNRDFIEEIKRKLTFPKDFYRQFQGKKRSAYTKDDQLELSHRKEALNQVLKPYGLDENQIPQRISDYWLQIRDVRNKSETANRIKVMKKDCVQRLKNLKENKSPKIGEMATFLAQDIVDMIIDKDVKKKITSFYYDKMQEALALFPDPEKKHLFISICEKELQLFNQQKGHPFLFKIKLNEFRTTSQLYEKYLHEKEN